MAKLACLFLCASTLAGEPVLLVLLKGASALAYYSMEGKLLATVPVGQHPHEMVVSSDGKLAYITDNGAMRSADAGKGGNSVSIVDIPGRKRIDTISTGRYRRPHGIALDERTGLLAATAESPDRLVLMHARDRRVLRHFDTKGKTSHMVSFGPGASGPEYAYVSNSGLGTVSAIQLTTGALKSIPTGERPEGSVLSKDGKELYVVNRDSSTITIIDTTRHAAIGEFKTGKAPVRIGITPDGATLVYACIEERAIEFAGVATRRPEARLRLDGEPVSLHISLDGKYALAAAQAIDTVYVVSLDGRRLVHKFQTAKGAGPDPVQLVNLP